MKKTILTFAVLAFFFMNAQAQESSVGIKAGINFSNLALGDDLDAAFEDNKTKMGFHAGLFYNGRITEFFALQPEVVYSLQGVKLEVPGDDELNYNLHYINVPILAKVYLGENFNIHAGPYVGFMIGSSLKYDGDVLVEDVYEDIYKTADFGIAGGIEFGAASGLMLGARYNLGLADIRDDDQDVFDQINDDNGSISNQVIQIYAGVAL